VSLTVTAARNHRLAELNYCGPCACFAMRPVSMTRRLPAKVLSMRCICCVVVSSEYHKPRGHPVCRAARSKSQISTRSPRSAMILR